MARMTQLDEAVRVSNSVVTVGTFDGVHAGHRVLIQKVVDTARQRDARSVIVTFDPHPREIIDPGASGIRLLSTLSERCELLADIGIDEMVVIPFDRDFSLMDSETFLENVIWSRIGVSEFVIGYDHQFGRDRSGTIKTVQQVGKRIGFDVSVVSRQEVGDRTVSSTTIRRALQDDGDVRLASRLLERDYRLNGTVVHGDSRGKEIGFPTANIQPEDVRKVIPKRGVYAVLVRIEGEYHGGMMNIGIRPTFHGEEERLEVHLFDYDEEIYGIRLQVRFVERVRDEIQFSGVEELTERLKQDRVVCKRILAEKE